LKEGDANTQFLNMAASSRRRVNYISSLRTGEQVLTSLGDMKREAIRYYREASKATERGNWRFTNSDFTRVDEAEAEQLVKPITIQEVETAMAGLNSEGSPGPDGFQVFFDKEFWPVVKADVMEGIKEFQEGNSGFERINQSYLFLLPKKQGAESLQEFRPIALTNSIYLIIGKVLANRFRGVLARLISPVQ
jgi:hypothetical protein